MRFTIILIIVLGLFQAENSHGLNEFQHKKQESAALEKLPRFKIIVTHIKFDYKGGNRNKSDALNIRKKFGKNNDLAHKGNGVGSGEWNYVGRNEPALYVANQNVKIKVRLTVVPISIHWADIEAKAARGLLLNIVKKPVQFINKISDFGALRNCKITSDTITDHLTQFGLIRNLSLKCPNSLHGEKQVLNIIIGVAHTQNENAHEMMFMNIPAVTQGDFGQGYKRGDKEGIRVGDFNFIPVGINTINDFDTIAFVRNNVFCAIDTNNTEGTFSIDIKNLAEQLDKKIVALPNLSAKAFDALRPKIVEFRPAKKQLTTRESVFTTLAIQITDPANDSFTTLLSSAGQLQINTSVDPPEIRVTHTTGILPIYCNSYQFITPV